MVCAEEDGCAVVGIEKMDKMGRHGKGCIAFALEEGVRKGKGSTETGGGGVPCCDGMLSQESVMQHVWSSLNFRSLSSESDGQVPICAGACWVDEGREHSWTCYSNPSFYDAVAREGQSKCNECLSWMGCRD